MIEPNHTARRRLPGVAVRVAALFLLAAGAAVPSAASAEAPLRLPQPVTDNAGVLSGDDVEGIDEAFNRLADDTEMQMFVVYVDSFDGADPQDWAKDTATLSGLGTDDILLAVATDDRAYAISVDDAIALSDKELDTVRLDDIRPALADGDWAGAAVNGADGYREAATSGGFPVVPVVVGGAAVVGGGAYLISRSRRRSRERAEEVALDANGQPVDPLAGLSTDELVRRAGSALVAIDDALKTSAQELGYAEAQFGTDATKDFSATLAAGRATVAEAFALRQQLDDSEPETDAEVRAMSRQIISMCEEVDDALDQQVEEFDTLRDLHASAPAILEGLTERATQAESRIPTARVQVEQLTAKYPASALASVAGNPDAAERILAEARASIAAGREVVDSDRAAAVAHVRAAEDAVGQAGLLLDAVAGADEALDQASRAITDGISSLSLDIADADLLAPDDPAISEARATAAQAVALGRAASTGDPLAAVHALEEAEIALDTLLAPLRAEAAEAEKARKVLKESLGRVTSQVNAVSAYVETRRGAVGPEARTRLSEAARHLDLATRASSDDPADALAEVQQAEQMAAQAQRLAESDVEAWERSQQPQREGSDITSMILGGILINSSLGRSNSGGWSGGSAGRSPGSFGGGSTRGRRGGGGRF